ncbi:MAG: hypothetical protein MK329_16315 [Pirellulales bacterium]|nr:hypothetical protein [Pirellulales bacterium]
MANTRQQNNLTLALAESVRQGRDFEGNLETQRFYYVEATTPFGYVFCHYRVFEAHEQMAAEAFLEKVSGKLNGANADSLDRRYWTQRGHHVYGSAAYQLEGGEDELRRFEAETAADYTSEELQRLG